MRSYLVRITPLIWVRSGGVFASLSYVHRSLDRVVLGSGLCHGLSRPRWLLRSRTGSTGGVNLAFQATKKTPRLCAEVSDLIY